MLSQFEPNYGTEPSLKREPSVFTSTPAQPVDSYTLRGALELETQVDSLKRENELLKKGKIEENNKAIEWQTKWMRLSEQEGDKRNEVLRLSAALNDIRGELQAVEERNAILYQENRKILVHKEENEALKKHFGTEPRFRTFLKAIQRGCTEQLDEELQDVVDKCKDLNDAKSLLVMRYLGKKLSVKARAEYFSYTIQQDTHPAEFPNIFRLVKAQADKLYITDKGQLAGSVSIIL